MHTVQKVQNHSILVMNAAIHRMIESIINIRYCYTLFVGNFVEAVLKNLVEMKWLIIVACRRHFARYVLI